MSPSNRRGQSNESTKAEEAEEGPRVRKER